MKRIYVLRDIAAAAMVGGLHLHSHDASAIRFFGDLASSPDTMVNRHPTDFELLHIGRFDDEQGELLPAQEPTVVITGSQWLAAQSSKETNP